ncbi:MAG: glutathione peroxidase, partial [Bacteroidaceae bacterium]|nr:glutathione peroxidase [Bacteroidaceae bacterium]
MSQYKGKVLLIVNTATGCGFTPQYKGLQQLYDKYKERGFEILDFPCNQFGKQAPGTNDEIENFCTLRYKTGLQDYINYKFYQKKHKERKTYASIGYQHEFYKIAA